MFHEALADGGIMKWKHVFATAVVLVPMCSLTKCVCVPHPCLLSRLGYQLILRSSCLPLHSRETHLCGLKSHWRLTAESSWGFILRNNFTDRRFSLLLSTFKNAFTTYESRNYASQNLHTYKTK